MLEAIYCRIKFAFMLGLFFLPILLSMWNQRLDVLIEEARYLPAPEVLLNTRPVADQANPPRAALADLSDPSLGGFPDP